MIITELPKVMAICLILTIIMEISAAYVMHVRKKEDFVLIALVNVFTNPVLTSVTATLLIFCGKTVHDVSEILFEIAIVAVEGLLYRKTLSWEGNPFVLSFVLNCFSYFFGKVISMIIF